MRNTKATLFWAKTVRTSWGKMSKMAGTEVKPRPMASERLTMIMLRWEKPQRAIMPKLAKTMLPNIIMVQPPSTAWGMVARIAPMAGTKPLRMRIVAPVAMEKRLTTLVRAASPTFCENEVMGVQPNSPATELTKPSQATDAPISFFCTSRPSAPEHIADVSPMVSVAETR